MTAWGRGARSASFAPGEATLRGLSADKLAPVYFIVGESPWLKEKLTLRLRDTAVPEAWRSTDAETVWAGEVTEAQVADSAGTPPFGSKRRFLLVRRAEEFRFKRRGPKREVASSPLVEYLGSPSPFTVLVLVSEGRGAAEWEGDALFEAARKAGMAVQCEPPREEELLDWIEEHANALGLKLAPGAAGELAERTGGGDQMRLERELEKLAAWMGGEGRAIGPGDVAALTGEAAPPSVFQFLDSLFVERSVDRGLVFLKRLLADMHPLQLHALLVGQLRKLVALAEAMRQGHNDYQIAREVKLPYTLVSRLGMMVNRTKPERFAELMKALADAESALKRGADGRAVLEGLVLELCAGGAGN